MEKVDFGGKKYCYGTVGSRESLSYRDLLVTGVIVAAAGRDQSVGGDAPGGVHVLLVDGHVAGGEGLAGAPLLRATHH